MRKTIVAGNWKLNGDTSLCAAFAVAARTFEQGVAEVLICPPAIWLATLADQLASTSFHVGGQNLASEKAGAYTGEISAAMLRAAGAKYCILGHSERRAIFAESSAVVAQKALVAIEEDLIPIVCVGEALDCREAGNAEAFVEQQLLESLDGLDRDSLSKVVVAYEPIWAIGTGVTASTDQAQEMHAHIRSVLAKRVDSEAVSLLYGGSVKPSNAKELIAQKDIDGALVGGASLKVDDFLAIVEAAG